MAQGLVAVGRLDEQLGLLQPWPTAPPARGCARTCAGRRRLAGSPRTQSSGRSGRWQRAPAAASWGQTAATTSMPASWASATSRAPGSATAGRPASEIRPRSCPCKCRAPAGPARPCIVASQPRPALGRARQLGRSAGPAAAAPAAPAASTRLSSDRVVLAFSAAQWRQPQRLSR